MPGSVAVSVVASGDVFPKSLCSAFTEVREPPVMLANFYHDGSRQASLLSQTSRKRFIQTVKLSASQLADLILFRDAHPGVDGKPSPARAFYFYNPFEPSSGQLYGSNYDATGAATVGRYKVRFAANGWSQSTGMVVTSVPIELIEVV